MFIIYLANLICHFMLMAKCEFSIMSVSIFTIYFLNCYNMVAGSCICVKLRFCFLYFQLEGLVSKWLDCGKDCASIPGRTCSLQDVVSGDAFVWRKLECVVWRNVAWEASVAHQLMLSALHMDARNIVSDSPSELVELTARLRLQCLNH